jgi:hypothetical protein
MKKFCKRHDINYVASDTTPMRLLLCHSLVRSVMLTSNRPRRAAKKMCFTESILCGSLKLCVTLWQKIFVV